jgi:hypothetical protein
MTIRAIVRLELFRLLPGKTSIAYHLSRFADIKAIMFDFPRQGAWFNRKQYREEVVVYCLWTDL